MTGLYVILGVVALLVVIGVVQYNKLVRLNVAVDEGFAQIEVQLQRRGDLIPNLVETVKGYAAHEKETFEKVVQARAQATAAQGVAAVAEADGMLTQALRGLLAVAEDYPDLIWGIGDLSRIQFDEYANPTEALRRNEQGSPGYFLGVDCRYGHLCLRNHDILAEKLLEGLESNTRPDLNKGFHRHFITPEWHKDQALIDSELNLDLVPHFHRMAEKNKNYIPWKIRAGIKSIFES